MPAIARQARPVLLVGALRERLNQVTALAAAARLTVLSVTSEALAVSAAFQRAPSSCGVTVLLRPLGADLVAHAGSQFCAVRHVPAAPRRPAQCRGIAGRADRPAPERGPPRPGDSCAQPDPRPGDRTDALGRDRPAPGHHPRHDRPTRRGSPVKNKLTEVGSRSPEAGEDSASVRFVPATALAIAGLNGLRPPIDLVHSRFAAPAKKILGRRVVWASAAAVVVLAAIAAVVAVWQREESAVSRLTAQVSDMKKDVDSAEDLVGKVAFARNWYEDRPKVLRCMRGMTAAFPSNGRAWVTRVTLKEPAPEIAPRAPLRPRRPGPAPPSPAPAAFANRSIPR